MVFKTNPQLNSQNATIEETMNDFKAYLSTRGADLCKTTQFLSFYALPYVPDPRQHPSFKDLFKPEWQDDVKDRMVEFLTTALRKRDLPRIAKIMESKVSKVS